MLKTHGLKSSGNNAELIQRLMDSAPEALNLAVKDINLVKCSPEAAEIVAKLEAVQEEAQIKALEESHAALLAGDAKKFDLKRWNQ